MTLFRLDASILPPTSASAELADLVEAKWAAAHPGEQIVRRNLGTEPLPAEVWALAATAPFVPESDRPKAQADALALAQELRAELKAADAVLLAVPLYNYGVSQHFKTWADLVIAGGDAGEQVLAGKPTVLATVRGGGYGAGTPREGWDHSTPYLRRILADMWGADLSIVERELTLAGVNPALDHLKELAAELRAKALEDADKIGTDFAAA
jgi:FMN-dependent NADH-azoreductase